MIEEHQLRDCQAWKDDRLELSTTSNEAAKLFDLALHQYVGWYENEKHGGLVGTLQSLRKADPNFGTGRTVMNDKALANELETLKKRAESNTNLSQWERLHVRAVEEWANGHQLQARATWERILLDHPQDILAVKMAADTNFYFGKFHRLRDVVARVIPEYRPSSSYYGYLKGMYAFGLEETNFYRQAEQYALQALEINKNDGWATHALTHVYEMEGKNKEGEKFLSGTKNDWMVCRSLACHLHWHWCLLLIEQGRYDEVWQLYDGYMHNSACSSKTMLDTVDMTSLLYRLHLEGVNVEGRWEDIYEICRPHMDDHVTAFNDIHFLMSICGMKKQQLAEDHLRSLINYANTGDGDNASVCRTYGIDIYKALKAYHWGDYKEAVELLTPIKDDIVNIGGSGAQRDIFNQILIHAAMKSPLQEHWKLAKSLLNERKALKEHSPLTDRLMAKLLTSHASLDNGN